jgi:hypothetical protein
VCPFLAALEHRRLGEDVEVLGHVLLSGPKLLGDRADAQLAVAEQIEDPHP